MNKWWRDAFFMLLFFPSEPNQISQTSWPALGSNLLVWTCNAWMKWVLCLAVAWMVAVLRWTPVPIQWGRCVPVLRQELRSSKMPSVSLSEETLCSGFSQHCYFFLIKKSELNRQDYSPLLFSKWRQSGCCGCIVRTLHGTSWNQILDIYGWRSLWIIRKLFLL